MSARFEQKKIGFFFCLAFYLALAPDRATAIKVADNQSNHGSFQSQSLSIHETLRQAHKKLRGQTELAPLVEETQRGRALKNEDKKDKNEDNDDGEEEEEEDDDDNDDEEEDDDDDPFGLVGELLPDVEDEEDLNEDHGQDDDDDDDDEYDGDDGDDGDDDEEDEEPTSSPTLPPTFPLTPRPTNPPVTIAEEKDDDDDEEDDDDDDDDQEEEEDDDDRDEPFSSPTLPPTFPLTPRPTNPPVTIVINRMTPRPTNPPVTIVIIKMPTPPPQTWRPTQQPTTLQPTQPPRPPLIITLPPRTLQPTQQPTTRQPTLPPTTQQPTQPPSSQPVLIITRRPTLMPTNPPTFAPTPTPAPTALRKPTSRPSPAPVTDPTTDMPTDWPSVNPSSQPSSVSTTRSPSISPSAPDSSVPTITSSSVPTAAPSMVPTLMLSSAVPSTSVVMAKETPTTAAPSNHPSERFSSSFPTNVPSLEPTQLAKTLPPTTLSATPTTTFKETERPSTFPTLAPSLDPTNAPTLVPVTSQPSASSESLFGGRFSFDELLNLKDNNKGKATLEFSLWFPEHRTSELDINSAENGVLLGLEALFCDIGSNALTVDSRDSLCVLDSTVLVSEVAVLRTARQAPHNENIDATILVAPYVSYLDERHAGETRFAWTTWRITFEIYQVGMPMLQQAIATLSSKSEELMGEEIYLAGARIIEDGMKSRMDRSIRSGEFNSILALHITDMPVFSSPLDEELETFGILEWSNTTADAFNNIAGAPQRSRPYSSATRDKTIIATTASLVAFLLVSVGACLTLKRRHERAAWTREQERHILGVDGECDERDEVQKPVRRSTLSGGGSATADAPWSTVPAEIELSDDGTPVSQTTFDLDPTDKTNAHRDGDERLSQIAAGLQLAWIDT